MNENTIVEKTLEFAIRIVNVYKYLTAEKMNMLCRNSCFAVAPALVQMLRREKEDRPDLIFVQK